MKGTTEIASDMAHMVAQAQLASKLARARDRKTGMELGHEEVSTLVDMLRLLSSGAKDEGAMRRYYTEIAASLGRISLHAAPDDYQTLAALVDDLVTTSIEGAM